MGDVARESEARAEHRDKHYRYMRLLRADIAARNNVTSEKRHQLTRIGRYIERAAYHAESGGLRLSTEEKQV